MPDKWRDGRANWRTAGDWSAGVPTSTTDVVVDEGDPQVAGPINIAALTNSATVDFTDAGASRISGAVTNTGLIDFDASANDGGSSLTIGGALTNTGTVEFGPTDNKLSASDAVSVKALVNRLPNKPVGTLALFGDLTGAHRMLLDVTTGAAGFGSAGVVSSTVILSGDAGIEFAKGQITSIAGGIGELDLNSSRAFIADAAAPGSNGALDGLRSVAGILSLANGAKIATTGNLTNTGLISLDNGTHEGGSSLTIGGALISSGPISLGPYDDTLTAADTVRAKSLVNSGRITLYGGPFNSSLAISGAVTNNGVIDLSKDKQVFKSAVDGAGSMFFDDGSTLTFDSSVGSGQTAMFGGGGDELVLGAEKTFAAHISQFFVGDSLDAKNFGTGTHFTYFEDSSETAGVLTLTNGANVAHLDFTGDYHKSDFSLTVDASSSLIKYV